MTLPPFTAYFPVTLETHPAIIPQTAYNLPSCGILQTVAFHPRYQYREGPEDGKEQRKPGHFRIFICNHDC